MKTFGTSSAIHQPNNNYSTNRNISSNGWTTTTNINSNHHYRKKSNKRRKFNGRKYRNNRGYHYRSTYNNKRQRIQGYNNYINSSGYTSKTADIDVLFKDLAVGPSSINDNTIKNYIKNTFSSPDEFIAAANASATVEPVFDPFLAQVTPSNPVNTILCLNLSDFNGDGGMNSPMAEAIAGYFLPTNIPLSRNDSSRPYTPSLNTYPCPTSVPSLPPTLNNNPYINNANANINTPLNKLLTSNITLNDLVRILPSAFPLPLTPSELGITSALNNNKIAQNLNVLSADASLDSTQNSENVKSLPTLESVREETVGEVNKYSPMRLDNKYKRQRKIISNKQKFACHPLSNITDIFVNKSVVEVGSVFLKGAKDRNLAISNAMVVNNTYEDMNASLRLKKLTATSNLLRIALKGDNMLKSEQMVKTVQQRESNMSYSKVRGKKSIQALRVLTNVDLQENKNPVKIIATGVSVVGSDPCSPTLIPFSVYNANKENIGLSDNGSGGKEFHNSQYFQHQKYMNMNMGMGNRIKKRRHYNRW